MTRRKGELSQKMIDLGWPHQVALPAEVCRGDGYLTTRFFCEGLSLCPRLGYFRRDDRDYVVFCFADLKHADMFRARFRGEPVAVQVQRRTAR